MNDLDEFNNLIDEGAANYVANAETHKEAAKTAEQNAALLKSIQRIINQIDQTEKNIHAEHREIKNLTKNCTHAITVEAKRAFDTDAIDDFQAAYTASVEELIDTTTRANKAIQTLRSDIEEQTKKQAKAGILMLTLMFGCAALFGVLAILLASVPGFSAFVVTYAAPVVVVLLVAICAVLYTLLKKV